MMTGSSCHSTTVSIKGLSLMVLGVVPGSMLAKTNTTHPHPSSLLFVNKILIKGNYFSGILVKFFNFLFGCY